MFNIKDRYLRNLGAISPIQQNKFLTKSIAIVGIGGQGGYLAEYLARLGVGELVLFDPDVYDETNLNRQTFATMETLGLNKAKAAEKAIQKINPDIKVVSYDCAFGVDCIAAVEHCDFIFACADVGVNAKDNRQAFRMAIEKNIPVMDVAVTPFGIALLVCWKELDMWDELTEDYCQGTVEDSHNIYQPAYLCALASALALEQMIAYFISTCPWEWTDVRVIFDISKGMVFNYRKPTEPVHSIGYEDSKN